MPQSDPKACLITIVDTTNPVLFEHFLKHYRKFGVELFYCCFHSVLPGVTPGLQKCIELFQSHSKGKYTLCTGEEYDPIEMVNKRDVLCAMSEEEGCNWRAFVDCDEFYLLHGSIDDFVKKIEPYCAARSILVDRLASSGFSEILKTENLFHQFPLNAFVTNDFLHATVSKIFLHKSDFDIFSGGHHFINHTNVSFYPEWLPCYHFKWDKGCIERLMYRRDKFKELGIPWWEEADRFVRNSSNCWDYLAQPQTGTINHNFYVIQSSTTNSDKDRALENISINLEAGF